MAQSSPEAVVLFSGPGGSSLGLTWAGVSRCVGVEWEANAVATARAAGFAVEHGDVREMSPSVVHDRHITPGATLVLQASPPCQGLSMAGKGTGRDDLVHLLAALDDLRLTAINDTELIEYCEDLRAWLNEVCSDEKSPLTFEMMRWVAELNPAYVMLEQVPAALPIWEAVAVVLRAWGYSVWCGNVQAEQFGVPQTRKRAFLLASRLHPVGAPVPTHSKYYSRDPRKLDEGVQKWVSMAEALGWGTTELVGFPRRADTPSNTAGDNVVEIGGVEYRARDLRGADQPAQVVTGKTRSWKRYDTVVVTGRNSEMGGGVLKPYERSIDAPAPTLTSQSRSWRIEGRLPTHMGDVYNSNGCIRSVDEPAPTMTASMDNGNFKWIDEEHPPAKAVDRLASRRPFEVPDQEIELANRRDSDAWIEEHGTRANRTTDKPAPTITTEAHRWSFVEVDRDAVVEVVPTHLTRVRGAGLAERQGPVRNRSVDEPSFTVTGGGTGSPNLAWIVDREALMAEVEPRMNNQSGSEVDLGWPADRPAPVIAGRGLVTNPGANANRFNGSTKSRNDGIRVEVFEAGILQSFPQGYPWQGTKTVQFQQVGNAVPPLLQAVTAHQLLLPTLEVAAA